LISCRKFLLVTYCSYFIIAISVDFGPRRIIRVGDRVRVRLSVSLPRYKWGSVTHHSIGTVSSIAPNGRDAIIDFPSHAHWTGLLSELEVVPTTHTNIQWVVSTMKLMKLFTTLVV